MFVKRFFFKEKTKKKEKSKGEKKKDKMSVFYLSWNFLWEQETKQQRSDKKESKGDTTEVETTLVERKMAQINIVNLLGFKMVPRDSLEAAYPLPMVCFTQGARPVRAARPQCSTNQYLYILCVWYGVCARSAHKPNIH